MFKALKKIQTDSQELDRVQDYVEEALQPVLISPLADGVLVKIVYTSPTSAIGTGDTYISHGLNRPVIGWFVVRTTTNAVIYESSTTSPNPNNILVLKASSAVNADITLWVF